MTKKKWVLTGLKGIGGAALLGSAVWSLLKRDDEDDILESGYEPKIGDGVDEDTREDPPED